MKNKKDIEKAKEKILDLGDEYDAKSYNLFMVFFTRLLNGFYIYRTRKASVHAGASTFFCDYVSFSNDSSSCIGHRVFYR